MKSSTPVTTLAGSTGLFPKDTMSVPLAIIQLPFCRVTYLLAILLRAVVYAPRPRRGTAYTSALQKSPPNCPFATPQSRLPSLSLDLGLSWCASCLGVDLVRESCPCYPFFLGILFIFDWRCF